MFDLIRTWFDKLTTNGLNPRFPYTQTEISLVSSGVETEPLSEAARLHLAAQIAPQVEALLQDALRDIQAKLPELIRSALDKEYAARQND